MTLGETIHLSVDCDDQHPPARQLHRLGETIHLSVDCDNHHFNLWAKVISRRDHPFKRGLRHLFNFLVSS